MLLCWITQTFFYFRFLFSFYLVLYLFVPFPDFITSLFFASSVFLIFSAFVNLAILLRKRKNYIKFSSQLYFTCTMHLYLGIYGVVIFLLNSLSLVACSLYIRPEDYNVSSGFFFHDLAKTIEKLWNARELDHFTLWCSWFPWFLLALGLLFFFYRKETIETLMLSGTPYFLKEIKKKSNSNNINTLDVIDKCELLRSNKCTHKTVVC